MADVPPLPSTQAIALRGDRFDPIWLVFFSGLIRAFQERDAEAAERATIKEIAGPPAPADVPAGEFRVIKNTISNTVSLVANDGGVLKTVALT